MILLKKSPTYNLTFICRKGQEHFAQPILKELEKKYTIQYLYPEHKINYFMLIGDIIWIEWANKFALQVSKKRWKNKKVIVRLHRNEIISRYMKKIKWGNIYNVIFVNSYFENEFKEKISSTIKTITIPNAIDIKSFPYYPHKYGKSICVYGFTFNPIKGYDLLLKMFRKLVNIDPEFHLTIMGMISKQHSSIRHLKEIKQQIINLNLTENVTIIEKKRVNSIITDRTNVSKFLRNHDIIMSYSSTESFHYSFAEGLLSGLEGFYNMWHNPLIAEFWKKWGYNNEKNLMNGILNWVNLSQEEKENKAQANREYVINNFSDKIISKKFEKLFWDN